MLRLLRHRRDSRSHRVEVDVRAGGQQRLVIKDGDALEPPLEERPARPLAIGHPGQRFLQAIHEPAQTLQSSPRLGHPGWVLEAVVDPSL